MKGPTRVNDHRKQLKKNVYEKLQSNEINNNILIQKLQTQMIIQGNKRQRKRRRKKKHKSSEIKIASAERSKLEKYNRQGYLPGT